MREANVFRKNRAFYSGVILTVVEGLLSGCSYLSIYMVLAGLSEGSLSAQRLGLLTPKVCGFGWVTNSNRSLFPVSPRDRWESM